MKGINAIIMPNVSVGGSRPGINLQKSERITMTAEHGIHRVVLRSSAIHARRGSMEFNKAWEHWQNLVSSLMQSKMKRRDCTKKKKVPEGGTIKPAPKVNSDKERSNAICHYAEQVFTMRYNHATRKQRLRLMWLLRKIPKDLGDTSAVEEIDKLLTRHQDFPLANLNPYDPLSAYYQGP